MDVSAWLSPVAAAVCVSPLDDVVVAGVVNQFAPSWVSMVVVAVLFVSSLVDMAKRVRDWRQDDE